MSGHTAGMARKGDTQSDPDERVMVTSLLPNSWIQVVYKVEGATVRRKLEATEETTEVSCLGTSRAYSDIIS